METAWHLSIDFGTSNSAAAHTPPGSTRVEALALTHRSNVMPSAVFAESTDASKLLTGDTALSRGRRDPSRLLLSPKRYIDHDNVQLAGADIPLHAVVGAVIEAVLKSGKAQHAQTEPTTVTLTHPEAWSAHSVDQLRASAHNAGIPAANLRTISEPRAAALHYASQQRIAAGGHVVVFDFGGGTLDVAVLQAENDGNFRVVSAKGDNSLGGRTLDNLLYRWVLNQIDRDDPDRADALRAAPMSVTHALESSIREAKELLSDTSSATISVSTPQGETDVLITRQEFNQIIEQSVQRAVELTQAALEQAGVDTANTPIYMTGGSSRIPFVQDRLGEVGMVMTLDDPKTVVSRGALAATLRGFTGGAPLSGHQQVASAPGGNAFPTTSSVPGATGVAAASGAAAYGGNYNAYGNAPRPAEGYAATDNYGANNTSRNTDGSAGYGPGNSPYDNSSYAASSYGNAAPNYGQANSTGKGYGHLNRDTAQTNQFGGQSFAQPQSYGAAGRSAGKKSKTPIIIAGAAAALLLIGGGAYAVTSGSDSNNSDGGSNSGGGGSTGGGNALPQFSEAQKLPDRSPRSDTSSYKNLTQIYPEVANFMPTAFYNRVDFCDAEPTDTMLGGNAAWTNVPHKFYECLMDRDILGEHSDSLAFNGFKYLLKGPDANANYDFLQNNPTVNKKVVQEAGNGWPQIIHVTEGKDFSRGSMVIWYPEEQFLMTLDLDYDANEEQQIKDIAKFYLFSPA